MHAKKRNGRISLYRSQYVRKGANGNSHGYAVQNFVGSMAADALEIPVGLAEKLSQEEIVYVDKAVVAPAKRAAEQIQREAEANRRTLEARERDPRWRLDEALRLLTDAGRLISEEGHRTDARKVSALHAALKPLTITADLQCDPLDAVLAAVADATAAVKGDYYGNVPNGNLRDTPVYKRWRSIGDAVDSGKDSLLKALQSKGWARVRG